MPLIMRLRHLLGNPISKNIARVGGLHPFQAILIEVFPAELFQESLRITCQKCRQSFRFPNSCQAPVGVTANPVSIFNQVIEGDFRKVPESLREIGPRGEEEAEEAVDKLSVLFKGIFIERESEFFQEELRVRSFVGGRIARQDLL